MKIKTLNELIEKHNKLNKNTSDAEMTVLFRTALEFIKKDFDKQTYERCENHINPGIAISMSPEDSLIDNIQKLKWICNYLVAIRND